jgi:hypothetical protein
MRSARGLTGMGSTESTTLVGLSPGSDLRAPEQSVVDMDFGFEHDFTFDSADFLCWDKLIEDYRNMPENQS